MIFSAMKTNTAVAYLTCLLVLSYLLVMDIKVDEYGEMSRFVPADTLIYFEQHNGGKALKRFKSSLFGQKISSVDLIEVGKEIGLSDELLSLVESVEIAEKNLDGNQFFYQLLGKRIAIAILPPVGNAAPADLLEYLRENTLIIAEPVHGAAFLGMLAERAAALQESGSFTMAQYGNHQIHRVVQDGNHISYAIIDGCFLISFDERLLRRSLDVFDTPQSSLAFDSEFLKSQQNFQMVERFLYLPVQNATRFVRNLLDRHDVPGEDILNKELKTIEGFSSVAYGTWQKNNIVEDKIVIRYDLQKVNDLVQTHVTILPQKSEMLSLVSSDPILYYWSNTFDFQHFIPYVVHSANRSNKVEAVISNFELVSGRTISEAISLLGDEVSLIVDKSPEGNDFSIPLTLLVVKSSSVKQFETIMKNIMVEYEIPMRTIHYQSAIYSYWKRSFQDGVRFLHGYYGEYFFIGNSTSLLKKVIDVHQSGKGLTTFKKVRPIDPGFKLVNNSITYFNNVEVISILQDVIDFYGAMLAVKNREASLKLRVINEKMLSPLLEGATMYDSSATRSYFIPDGVILESKTHISK